MSRVLIVIGLLTGVLSCATFYEVNYNFNTAFEHGEVDQALRTLREDKRAAKGTSRFLYMVNNGLLLSMMGRYEESNEYLERAYLFGEDYRVNYIAEAATYLTNPQITVYRGEDHEHLMLLYYKALNFLKMDRYEEALVECRRLNIRLQQLSDKYTSDTKFQRDAFINNLMGIIYQASGDWNNAFIAYRNAVDIYESDYARFFSMTVPDQLKADVITAAQMSGFPDEADHFREKFSMQDFVVSNPEGALVFFWHNGLTPVKDEFSLTFAINHQGGNMFVFDNKNMAMAFPFDVPDHHDRQDLSDLEVFRVAFPRYVERPVLYTSAAVYIDTATYSLQLAENVNDIAFYSLRQRMLAEFSKTLLRAALKKAAEYSLRKEDKTLGALLGMVNAATEKADTRNWQTLPHSILYIRVPLHAGKNNTRFVCRASDGTSEEHSFTYSVKKGQTIFHTFSSIASFPPHY